MGVLAGIMTAVGLAGESDGVPHVVMASEKIQNIKQKWDNLVQRRIPCILNGLVVFTKILRGQNHQYTTILYVEKETGMKRLLTILTLLVFASLAAAACNIPASSTQQAADAAMTVTIIPAEETATAPAFECQATFESRELKAPYTGTKPRYILSTDEWNGYLNLMGIQSLCIPVELGAPFLNADWDSAKIPATGRMLSIGFENLYPGSGWSDIFLIYSTYDFIIGTEYDRFASLEDREALRDHTILNEIEINGIRGFTRFKASMWTYENQPQIIYKTAVFPFENYYVAVVYKLGAFDEDVPELTQKFEMGDYPTDRIAYVEMMDFLVNSLHFEQTP